MKQEFNYKELSKSDKALCDLTYASMCAEGIIEKMRDTEDINSMYFEIEYLRQKYGE